MEKTYFSPKSLLCLFSIFLLGILLHNHSYAQQTPPQGINYQAIARDTAGNAIANTDLVVRFTILSDTVNNTSIFTEVHNPVHTNIYGLFTLVIGTSEPANFSALDWTSGAKYLEVKIAKVGTDYFLTHTTRLMSVPYALYSKSSGNSWQLDGNTITDTTQFIGTVNSQAFIIKTDSVERVRVTANGKVSFSENIGVRVVNPASPVTIRTNTGNEIEFISTSGDSAGISSSTALTIGTSTVAPVLFKTNDSSHVLIDSSGNVGIGTTSPVSKLDVAGQVKITDGTEGYGKTLTSDAIGRASWVIPDSGTVLSFSADSLLPLFSTTVTDDTINPHLSFTLENAGPYRIFGNDSAAGAQPAYFKPRLDSPLFSTSGTANQVLHGNASGAPSWGQITNADIASGAVSLTTNVTGILPMTNGGTGAALTPANGGVVYTNASTMQVSPAGTSGQVLVSGGAGAPVWTNPTGSITLTGVSPISTNATTATNYDISVGSNTSSSAGVVSAGTGNNYKVWKTDANGNPGWRADSSNVWSQVGNDIYNNNTQGVGIGVNNPINKLDVNGGDISINGFNGHGIRFKHKTDSLNRIYYTSSTNSLHFDSDSLMYFNKGFYTPGNVGIGVTNPTAKLDVRNDSTTGSAGYFENMDLTTASPTLVTISNSDNGGALFVSETGLAGAAIISVTNSNNSNDALQINTNGDDSRGLLINHTGAGVIESYGAHISTTGAGETNIAGYFNAENGTDNFAGIFENGNVGIGTTFPVAKLEVVTSGDDEAIYAETNGDGAAGSFNIFNPTNTDDALDAYTNGTGSAGYFQIDNTLNASPTLDAYTNGTGSAGSFQIANSSNASPALDVNTNGSGNSIWAINSGSGSAGRFEISGTLNSSDALVATSNGMASAGYFNIQKPTNTADVLKVKHDGIGRAASFTSTLSGNASSTVYIHTSGSSSKALEVINNGQGATDYGAYATSIGAGTNNIGGYFSAGGATNNYAAIFDQGNVGIGTTTPNSAAKLEVAGQIKITGGSPGNGKVLTSDAAGLATWLAFSGVSGSGTLNYIPKWTSTSALGTSLIYDNGTTVGIGTAIPGATYKLDVSGKINASRINLNEDIATSNGYHVSLNRSTNVFQALLGFHTAGAQQFSIGLPGSGGNNLTFNSFTSGHFIFSGGNVGIGTTSVVNALDVEGGVAIGPSYSGNTIAPTNGLIVQGNVGLGVSSAANKLDVGGSVAIGTGYVGNVPAGNSAIIEGNVGIGTTAPTQRLTIDYVGGSTDPLKISNSTGATTTFHLTSDQRMLFSPSTTSTATLIEMGTGTGNITGAGVTFMKINSGAVPSGSNVLSIQEAGASYLTVTGAGNVGIGTTNPLNKLTIGGITGTWENALLINPTSAAGSKRASLQMDDWTVGQDYQGNGTKDFFIYQNSATAQRLFIGTTGNVGIGTATPASQVRLHVYENAIYTAQVKIDNPNAGANAGSQLSLYNNTSNSAFLHFGSSANNTLAGPNGLAIGTVPAGKVQFYTLNTARVTIDTTGNVGIGTATPGTKLEVNGAVTYTPSVPPVPLSGGTLTPGNNGFIKLNPTSNVTIGMSGSGAKIGQTVIIENVSSLFTVTISDNFGVRLSGIINYTMQNQDTLTLIYDGTDWVEVARGDNTP